MTFRRWFRLAAGVASLTLGCVVLALPGKTVGSYTTPFYTDVTYHWAVAYIRVLWEEEVTPETGFFNPDSSICRPDFGDWLVRIHPGEAFAPPSVALRLRDVVASPPSVLQRQEAVAVLIEALGLDGFAQSLDPTAADSYLRQFRDGSLVAPDLRLAMALAIRLKIVEGYPDRTLQPRRALTRAEAATVLFRSCLLLVEATPNPFSPDGDGAEDTTTFRLGSLRNRNSQSWRLAVVDKAGNTLRSFAGSGGLPGDLTWDGRDQQGRPLTIGTYYYQGRLRDRNGMTHYSALKPIVIEEKGLTAHVQPSFIVPGGTLRLFATASGGPSRVEATFEPLTFLGPVRLMPLEGSRDWRATIVLPPETPPGRCLVKFVARYPTTTRTAQAWFEVRGLGVTGVLHPNPVSPEQALTVTAWTNQVAGECTARFDLPSHTFSLALLRTPDPEGRHAWTSTTVIPAGVPPGRYPVTITARRKSQVAQAGLWLEVTEWRQELLFIITD